MSEVKAATVHNLRERFTSVIVCEHASNHIPEEFGSLGISKETLSSHVAWDPGALEVSHRLAELMRAPLVACEVSRLVYDCNRPTNAVDAIPPRSEVFDIPGNKDLSEEARDERITKVYIPFSRCVEDTIARSSDLQALITIHSFTPIYHGEKRDVEIGILHDSDARLADSMLQIAHLHSGLAVRRNEPYGPQHGVMHTLQKHGVANNLLNVMIEVRNDLIETEGQCFDVARMLHEWLLEAMHSIDRSDARVGQVL